MRELFYAMLLPSGNDAAVTLARYFGPLVSGNSPRDMGVDEEEDEEASIGLFVQVRAMYIYTYMRMYR